MELYDQIICLFNQGYNIEQIAQQTRTSYRQVVEAIEIAQLEFDQRGYYECA